MSLLVVGTLAFDSIETPNGCVDDVLGGSASFFSYAASFFTTPRLVGVVGDDFPEQHRKLFAGRNIDTTGLVTQAGKTFRWKGRYHQDMNTRDTLEVHLNVFGSFDPVLPANFRDSSHVFLANSSPIIQAKVLDQVQKPKLVMADTMDLWINTQREDLLETAAADRWSAPERQRIATVDRVEKSGARLRSGTPSRAEIRDHEESRTRSHPL